MAGCAGAPDVVVCTPTTYDDTTLTECGCGLAGAAPGILTAVVAAPGSFSPGDLIRVLHMGDEVAFANAAHDGSFARAVVLPGPAQSDVELVLAYGRDSRLTVHVPASQTAVVTGELELEEAEPEVLHYAATTRATAWLDCQDPIAPTPAPRRIFAANLTTSQASVVDAPALGAPWDVRVAGEANDLAIVVVQHEGGGISGCFQSSDACCDCPAAPGHLRLHRAHCSAELTARGTCAVRGGTPLAHDAGTDASRPPRADAYFDLPDTNVDGGGPS